MSQVEPAAQVTLPLAPTVSSHEAPLVQLTEHDWSQAPVQVLSMAQASEQLLPAHPESVRSHALAASH